MICYKDRTYCNNTLCKNSTCDRKLTDDILNAAEEKNLPVSVANLNAEAICLGFTLKEYI